MQNDPKVTNHVAAGKNTLDLYNDFEQKILRKVFQDEYSKNLKTYDLIGHMDHMAAEYNISDSQHYWSARTALKEFSAQHRALINGAVGERRAYNAIKHASCHKRIISNVRLEHDGELVEIDFVVITKAGIFCIEVKNYAYDLLVSADGSFKNHKGESYNNYNIGERMSADQYILDAVISNQIGDDYGPKPFGILLNASRSANVTNLFPYIDLCSLGNISAHIDSASLDASALSESLIDKIAECIEKSMLPQSETNPECFHSVSEKLDAFIAEIEMAVCLDEKIPIETAKTEQGPTKRLPSKKGLSLREAGICACSLLIGAAGGFAFSKVLR